jgi:hypothetical protein
LIVFERGPAVRRKFSLINSGSPGFWSGTEMGVAGKEGEEKVRSFTGIAQE